MTEYVYRVTREDTQKGFYHASLVKVCSPRAYAAIKADARNYGRYQIVKVERAEVAWEDVTESETQWKHDPAEPDFEGRTFCRRCGRRIYQNTGSIIRERHPDEWGHEAPVGNQGNVGFLFTCDARP